MERIIQLWDLTWSGLDEFLLVYFCLLVCYVFVRPSDNPNAPKAALLTPLLFVTFNVAILVWSGLNWSLEPNPADPFKEWRLKVLEALTNASFAMSVLLPLHDRPIRPRWLRISTALANFGVGFWTAAVGNMALTGIWL